MTHITLDLPTPGGSADVWADKLNAALAELRDGYNLHDDGLAQKVDDADLADAIAAQIAGVRQLPAGGTDGFVLAWVAGSPAWEALPGGGTGGTYPPIGGIPYADLSATLQAAIDKAGSALQSIPSTYTTDDELAAAIAGVTLATLGAQPAGSYANAADLDNVFGIVTDPTTGLATRAPLADAHLTGIPTAPTAAGGTNSTQLATTAFVKAAVDALVAGAPGALDTLNELATALTNDESTVSALTTTVASKVPQTRTVNGKALSADVTLAATDVGAAPTSHTHLAAQISDSTAVGRSLITAVDGPAARGAIGAGTSSLALGTSSTTAKAGDWKPAATDVTDSTTTGRALVTAASQTAARNALGFYDIALNGSIAGIPEGATVFEAAS